MKLRRRNVATVALAGFGRESVRQGEREDEKAGRWPPGTTHGTAGSNSRNEDHLSQLHLLTDRCVTRVTSAAKIDRRIRTDVKLVRKALDYYAISCRGIRKYRV